MRQAVAVSLVVFLSLASGCADRSQSENIARKDQLQARPAIVPNALDARRIAAADTTVKWDAAALTADIDCDGISDSIFVGRSASRVSVGVVRSQSRSPAILSFGTHGAGVQDDVGSADAKLAVESLDYDPTDAVGAIEGFERSKKCKGLSLGDGETDSMHIFWNRKTKQLEWWRA